MDSKKESLVPKRTLSAVAQALRDADTEAAPPKRDREDQVRASIQHAIDTMAEHKTRFAVLCDFPEGPWFTTLPCSRIHKIAREFDHGEYHVEVSMQLNAERDGFYVLSLHKDVSSCANTNLILDQLAEILGILFVSAFFLLLGLSVIFWVLMGCPTTSEGFDLGIAFIQARQACHEACRTITKATVNATRT